MDKLMGTIYPAVDDKRIASIEVKVKISTEGVFKVSDIQLQEGRSCTQHNPTVSEQYTDDNEEMHFNFVARGVTTMIIPYASEAPHRTSGQTLPCETDYITTPIKTDLLVHKPYSKDTEQVLAIGSGLTGTSKRFELNIDIVEGYANCVYDGYTSRQYVNGVEKYDVFVGRELRLPNADAKYTLNQESKRKSTGVFYAKKTRRQNNVNGMDV